MSHDPKFKVGDKVRLNAYASIRTVVIPEPDTLGRIVFTDEDGTYIVNYQDDYVLVPQRYTVELRVPKVGERYLCENQVLTVYGKYPYLRPVIVEEL